MLREDGEGEALDDCSVSVLSDERTASSTQCRRVRKRVCPSMVPDLGPLKSQLRAGQCLQI